MSKLMATHRLYVLLAVVCGGAIILWAQGLGFHLFELDGNAVDSPAGLPADWGSLYPPRGNLPALKAVLPDLEAYNFVAEPNINTSIFTSGGSKDIYDIDQWAWKDGAGGHPDKDNLLNASAASVKVNGDRVIYLHADRYANDGTAEMAFWVFQDAVKLGTNKVGGGTGFTGKHQNGDIFVRATFTNGGAEVTISVDTWQNGVLVNLFDSTKALCTAASEKACGISNSGPEGSPWPYQAKNYVKADEFPMYSFFEVAVNVSSMFRERGIPEPPCFASFLAETRSSHTTNATLKDFVLGAFDVCSIAIAKNCTCSSFDPNGPNAAANTGFNYSFLGTVAASGGTLYDVTVTDQGKTYDCGAVTPGQPKTFGGPVPVAAPTATQCAGPAGTFTDDVFPSSNQASVVAKTSPSGGGTLTAETGEVSCSTESPAGACTPNPQLTVDKVCVTALEVVGNYVVVRVDYTGNVYNNGNVNLKNVEVTEDHNAEGVDRKFTIGTLAAASSKCYTNNESTCPALTLPLFGAAAAAGAASYYPDRGTGITPGRVKFGDKVRATGINPFTGAKVESHPVGGGYSAECKVCPAGACPVP